jgi:hypothetical protein
MKWVDIKQSVRTAEQRILNQLCYLLKEIKQKSADISFLAYRNSLPFIE